MCFSCMHIYIQQEGKSKEEGLCMQKIEDPMSPKLASASQCVHVNNSH